jgi:hypothetical protein
VHRRLATSENPIRANFGERPDQELRRTPLRRSSENDASPNFAEADEPMMNSSIPENR